MKNVLLKIAHVDHASNVSVRIAIWSGLKLTALALVCDCKILSILVAFFILFFYVVWKFLLPIYQVQNHFSVW